MVTQINSAMQSDTIKVKDLVDFVTLLNLPEAYSAHQAAWLNRVTSITSLDEFRMETLQYKANVVDVQVISAPSRAFGARSSPFNMPAIPGKERCMVSGFPDKDACYHCHPCVKCKDRFPMRARHRVDSSFCQENHRA